MSTELTAEVHIVLVACAKSKGTQAAAAKILNRLVLMDHISHGDSGCLSLRFRGHDM